MQWWDAVDVIGVDAYYPLAPTNTNPCACSLSMPLCAYLSYNPSQAAPPQQPFACVVLSR